MASRNRWLGVWTWPALLFVVVFAVDLASPSGMTADSIRQVPVAISMVHYHTIGLDHLRYLLVSPGIDTVAVGNHLYPKYPWGGAVFAVPWVLVYDIAHLLGIGSGSITTQRSGHGWDIQVLTASAVVAATTVVIYQIALRVLTIEAESRRRRWAAGVAVAFAFATPAWSTASRSLWEHGPSMLCLSVALLCALRAMAGERGWTGFGVALGCAYAMRPTDALAIVVLGAWVLLSQRQHVFRVLLGGLLPIGILVVVDLVAYHQLLTPYYTQGGGFALSSTIPTAVAGNLVSPGRGLLVYVPLVLLSAWGAALKWRDGRVSSLWRALTAYAVVHWLVISFWKQWWAGDSYGPRLWTDVLPVLVVLALPAIDRLARGGFDHQRAIAGAVAVGLVWGFFVHAQGAILRSSWCWNNEPTDVDIHPSNVWNWSDAQFVRGIRTLTFGPNRHSELIRDGVDRIGCPAESVRP